MMRLTFSEICTSEEEEEDWGEGRGDNRGMNVQLSGRRGEGEESGGRPAPAETAVVARKSQNGSLRVTSHGEP